MKPFKHTGEWSDVVNLAAITRKATIGVVANISKNQKERMVCKKTLFLDVMLNDRFVCTLKYKFCPLFPIELDDLKKFIESKRPSLKGKDYRIAF